MYLSLAEVNTMAADAPTPWEIQQIYCSKLFQISLVQVRYGHSPLESVWYEYQFGMEMFVFRMGFHRSWLVTAQLTIRQCLFRWWVGAVRGGNALPETCWFQWDKLIISIIKQFLPWCQIYILGINGISLYRFWIEDIISWRTIYIYIYICVCVCVTQRKTHKIAKCYWRIDSTE